MARRFAITTPEDLRALEPFIKSGRVKGVAAAWSSARRRNGGECVWNGKIEVIFRTEGRERVAEVIRTVSRPDILAQEAFARLKYIPALRWCQEHLQEVDVCR